MIQGIINEFGGIKSIFGSSRPKSESIMYIMRAIHLFIFQQDKIKFLGGDFYYSDKNTPLLLQWYPKEIEAIITRAGKINTCLDIGANIGQFAYTLKKYNPDVEVISIEPQKEAIKIMGKNVLCKIIEACVGKGKQKTMYIEEGKNDRSSSVAGVNRRANKEIKVNAIKLTKSKCKKLGIKTEYDLIKVDVEGGEKEVLECIKELEWKFLQLESTEEQIKDIERLIKNQWNNSQLIYKNNVTFNSSVINYIFKRK
ncbi:FkbM family methyltransferase [Candidatus Pacearchaeota archaeon]|nr:FkbM family methyltransferase [Candidatus Pacearchaeota archaeon]